MTDSSYLSKFVVSADEVTVFEKAPSFPPPLEPVAIPNPLVVGRYVSTEVIDDCMLRPSEVFEDQRDYWAALDYPGDPWYRLSESHYYDQTLDDVLAAIEYEPVYYAAVYRDGESSPLCYFDREEPDDDIIWHWN